MTYRIFTTSLAAIFTLGLSQGAVAASQGKASLTIDHAAIFAQLDTDGNGLLAQAELAKAAQLRFKMPIVIKMAFCHKPRWATR